MLRVMHNLHLPGHLDLLRPEVCDLLRPEGFGLLQPKRSETDAQGGAAAHQARMQAASTVRRRGAASAKRAMCTPNSAPNSATARPDRMPSCAGEWRPRAGKWCAQQGRVVKAAGRPAAQGEERPRAGGEGVEEAAGRETMWKVETKINAAAGRTTGPAAQAAGRKKLGSGAAQAEGRKEMG